MCIYVYMLFEVVAYLGCVLLKWFSVRFAILYSSVPGSVASFFDLFHIVDALFPIHLYQLLVELESCLIHRGTVHCCQLLLSVHLSCCTVHLHLYTLSFLLPPQVSICLCTLIQLILLVHLLRLHLCCLSCFAWTLFSGELLCVHLHVHVYHCVPLLCWHPALLHHLALCILLHMYTWWCCHFISVCMLVYSCPHVYLVWTEIIHLHWARTFLGLTSHLSLQF
jgi:hypothetical protein